MLVLFKIVLFLLFDNPHNLFIYILLWLFFFHFPITNNCFLTFILILGSNLLLVGVQGPQTPCEEVNVKHIGGKKYAVTYSAQEPGKYLLVIKWGTDHVPGSPFHLTIPWLGHDFVLRKKNLIFKCFFE